ncbi:fructose PTS transporter subunit IIA [Pelosinus sp. IPA-1]|uniref:PTS sugar transporter subunit IIA n=1 Tax=Pelosinus sp. IPA-1 TaxID=3029569 RepID=UPI0024361BF6|nr:fructose PTS transporter subunit IIA [Pelosinus sp. IPA-1]GMB01153.1 PTS fructose transporter subunit IIA [Pelosinus sp. IPA-1]
MDNIINVNVIDLHLKRSNKDAVMEYMADLINQDGRLTDKEEYIKSVKEREATFTTGIGFGVAIPHGKSDAVKVPTVAFGKCRGGMDWQAVDDKPVYMVFLIAVPKQADSNQHLKILAALSRKLMHDEFRKEILETEDKGKVCSILETILS